MIVVALVVLGVMMAIWCHFTADLINARRCPETFGVKCFLGCGDTCEARGKKR